MKLVSVSLILPLIFVFWVELFDFTMARPASVPQRREGLPKLQLEMRKMLKMLTQDVKLSEMMQDFEHDLTSLPTLSFGAKDLTSLEVSSTLAQLYSGLKNFLFHLDWLQREQEELEMDYSRTKKIAHHIKMISLKVLGEIGIAPSEPIYPTLPPLNTSWSMNQVTMEIYKKLYLFSDWYTRALGYLKHRR